MSAFLDELAEWVASAQRRRKESLVGFLAVRSDIEEAMRAGYALKTVWAHLRETGRIACRYETFCAHVRRHIKLQRPGQRIASPGVKSKRSDTAQSKPLGQFSFDPNPRKEELL
jgi:hypothetical protein